MTARPAGAATRPRRVLMTADAVGGVWRYAADLARELAAAGDEVLLAIMGPEPNREQVAELEETDGIALVTGAFRLEWMDEPWEDVDRAGAWLLALRRDRSPDVVHLNGFAHASLPWGAPVVVVGHSCVASWWEAVRGRRAPRAWDEYRRRVRAGLAAADAVVAPTAAMLAALRRHHGPLPRSRVIPNGADPCAYRSAAKEPFALTIGRLWDEAKNVGMLAGVAAHLPWPVRAIGPHAGPGGEARAAPGLELLGPLPRGEVAGWLARAGVYAHPARYEPFGLSVLEAALSGCALVLADIPSLREVWGDTAHYADPDDPTAWRQALRRAMGDAGLREELAARSLARGRGLTTRVTASGYRELYAELTGELAEEAVGT